MYYFIQYFVILDCLKNYKSRFNKTKKATVLLWQVAPLVKIKYYFLPVKLSIPWKIPTTSPKIKSNNFIGRIA